jgi:hypothetical protein
MIMPDKMIKFLKIINDYLWYNEEGDNIVVIAEDNFIKNNLSIEDVKILLETLINKSIVEEYNIEDRFRRAYPTSYEDKIKYIENPVPLTARFSKEVLGTPLYFIVIKDRKKLMEFIKNEQRPNILQDKQEVEFDSQIGVITYGKEQYKIQSDVKLALMKKLWEERKEIKVDKNGKEKIIRKGMMWQKHSLAYHIEKNQKETYQAIDDLYEILKEKGFPLKIKRANGAQLIVKILK